jgi:serine/threonine protein kinase
VQEPLDLVEHDRRVTKKEVVLGAGGSSNVYRVHDRVEGHERSLKVFRNTAGIDDARREINALRQIRHPHVVEVFWADTTRQGDWYLITEYVHGEPLTEYVSGRRHLRDSQCLDVALDILSALIAIHPDTERLAQLDARRREDSLSDEEVRELTALKETGVVHRDIKPSNVMLTPRGATLLDFNIASNIGDPVDTRSGTPPYQPPDPPLTQWDVSTDLFAVGVLLYQLLCRGHHPYPGGRPMAGEVVIDPRTIRPDLDDRLAGLLMRACAPTRSQRFQTAITMDAALRELRTDVNVPVR